MSNKLDAFFNDEIAALENDKPIAAYRCLRKYVRNEKLSQNSGFILMTMICCIEASTALAEQILVNDQANYQSKCRAATHLVAQSIDLSQFTIDTRLIGRVVLTAPADDVDRLLLSQLIIAVLGTHRIWIAVRSDIFSALSSLAETAGIAKNVRGRSKANTIVIMRKIKGVFQARISATSANYATITAEILANP